MNESKTPPNPLLPLIKACQKKRGLKSIVLNRMVVKGVPGNWANLSSWLHPNESKRRSPHPDTMDGLLDIAADLKIIKRRTAELFKQL